MANEWKIQNVLWQYASNKGHWGIVPNLSWFYGQADLISVTKARFSHEYEIKCSKADFKRDFKDKVRKHKALASGKGRIPNYFWFVTHFEKDNNIVIPKYAGHIRLTGNERGVILLKPAPRLHPKKLNKRYDEYVARGLMIRYWTQRLREK